MTGRWVILSVVVAVGAGCTSSTAPYPAWVTSLIQELESEPVANPPASLTRYAYQGQVVYYLPPRCCDIPSNLYNDAGVIICHPDGGLTGTGDGLCPDFLAQRSNGTLIWRDPRGAG